MSWLEVLGIFIALQDIWYYINASYLSYVAQTIFFKHTSLSEMMK